MKLPGSTNRTGKGQRPWKTQRPELQPVRSMRPFVPSPGVADQVSLSRLYHSLKSSEMTVRLHSLRLQVAQRTYFVPAIEITRGIIEEHLAAV